MLVDIPAEEISKFLHVLEKELPQSLFILNFIETSCKWKQKNDQLQISLLYTESSMETGVFVGVVKSGVHGVLVAFYALDNYENDLEMALKQVPLSDWKDIRMFEGIAEKHTPVIEKLIIDLGLEMYFVPLILVSMPKEEALKLNIICPEEVELAPLTEQHADEMYEIWLMNGSFVIDALKNSIRYNDEAAYGVFCKKSGDLLARCVRSQAGVLVALQTVEKARNKGYAKLLLGYVAKKMAERDILPCSYTANFNQVALNTFRSVGYNEVCKMRNYGLKT